MFPLHESGSCGCATAFFVSVRSGLRAAGRSRRRRLFELRGAALRTGAARFCRAKAACGPHGFRGAALPASFADPWAGLLAAAFAPGRKMNEKSGSGFAGVIYLSYLCTRNRQGSLAQLVQSVCLTSRGSGVRIPQLPRRATATDFGPSLFFVLNGARK